MNIIFLIAILIFPPCYDHFTLDDDPPPTLPSLLVPPIENVVTQPPSPTNTPPPHLHAPATTSSHPMTTRFHTGSLKPHVFLNLYVTSDISFIPRSTTQAMCDPNWKSIMDADMSTLTNNHTWDFVPHPPTTNIVGY